MVCAQTTCVINPRTGGRKIKFQPFFFLSLWLLSGCAGDLAGLQEHDGEQPGLRSEKCHFALRGTPGWRVRVPWNSGRAGAGMWAQRLFFGFDWDWSPLTAGDGTRSPVLPLLSAASAPGGPWDGPMFCSLWVAPGQSYGLAKCALIPRLNGHICPTTAAWVPSLCYYVCSLCSGCSARELMDLTLRPSHCKLFYSLKVESSSQAGD